MIIASSAKGPVWSRWGLDEKASLVICALCVPSGLGSCLERPLRSRPSSSDCPGRPTMSLQCPGPSQAPPLRRLIPLAISTRITPHSSPPPRNPLFHLLTYILLLRNTPGSPALSPVGSLVSLPTGPHHSSLCSRTQLSAEKWMNEKKKRTNKWNSTSSVYRKKAKLRLKEGRGLAIINRPESQSNAFSVHLAICTKTESKV